MNIINLFLMSWFAQLDEPIDENIAFSLGEPGDKGIERHYLINLSIK